MSAYSVDTFSIFQRFFGGRISALGFRPFGAANNNNALDIGVALGDDAATIAMIEAFNQMVAPHQDRLKIKVGFHDGST
jgi:hypothetical protein